MPDLTFDNRFVHDLPADPEANVSSRQVLGAAYTRVMPTPVAKPRVLAWSAAVATAVGLTRADVESPEFAQVFAGKNIFEMPATKGAWFEHLMQGVFLLAGNTQRFPFYPIYAPFRFFQQGALHSG